MLHVNEKEADRLWNNMLNSDPLFGKTALMICCHQKNPAILKLFIAKSQETDMNFNLQDFYGKSAFIYACQFDEGSEHWKVVVTSLIDKEKRIEKQQKSIELKNVGRSCCCCCSTKRPLLSMPLMPKIKSEMLQKDYFKQYLQCHQNNKNVSDKVVYLVNKHVCLFVKTARIRLPQVQIVAFVYIS